MSATCRCVATRSHLDRRRGDQGQSQRGPFRRPRPAVRPPRCHRRPPFPQRQPMAATLPGFREAVVAYCDAMEALVRRLVPLYARALGLAAHVFSTRPSPTPIQAPHDALPATACRRRRIRHRPAHRHQLSDTSPPQTKSQASQSRHRRANGSPPRRSPARSSSTAASSSGAGPTTDSSRPPHRAVNHTGGERYASPFSATPTSIGRSPPCRPASVPTIRRNTRRLTTPTTWPSIRPAPTTSSAPRSGCRRITTRHSLRLPGLMLEINGPRDKHEHAPAMPTRARRSSNSSTLADMSPESGGPYLSYIHLRQKIAKQILRFLSQYLFR